LHEAAQTDELRPVVEEVAVATLRTEGWRGLEQAATLVAHLDHEAAAESLLPLLEHRRREVAVRSAWAFGKLQVPATYPKLLQHAEAQHARYVAAETPGYERMNVAAQLAQLFQVFGVVKMREAHPLLRKMVPKSLDLELSRTAACWALGRIYDGETDERLAAQFQERLADTNSMPPEEEQVRRMCAIGLGRMKVEAAVPTLQQFTNEGNEVGLACWWSIHLLTGKEPPPPAVTKNNVVGWFLQPVSP
jgi:HEAT repeat protein